MLRERDCTPPPHTFVHVLQSPKAEMAQSTGAGVGDGVGLAVGTVVGLGVGRMAHLVEFVGVTPAVDQHEHRRNQRGGASGACVRQFLGLLLPLLLGLFLPCIPL